MMHRKKAVAKKIALCKKKQPRVKKDWEAVFGGELSKDWVEGLPVGLGVVDTEGKDMESSINLGKKELTNTPEEAVSVDLRCSNVAMDDNPVEILRILRNASRTQQSVKTESSRGIGKRMSSSKEARPRSGGDKPIIKPPFHISPSKTTTMPEGILLIAKEKRRVGPACYESHAIREYDDSTSKLVKNIEAEYKMVGGKNFRVFNDELMSFPTPQMRALLTHHNEDNDNASTDSHIQKAIGGMTKLLQEEARKYKKKNPSSRCISVAKTPKQKPKNGGWEEVVPAHRPMPKEPEGEESKEKEKQKEPAAATSKKSVKEKVKPATTKEPPKAAEETAEKSSAKETEKSLETEAGKKKAKAD